MADLTPKPTGISSPTVPSAWDTYASMIKARNQPAPAAPQDNEQGTFGDLADSFQRGVAQTVGGDLETVGQLTDSQKTKDMGRAVSAWGDSQTAQMSRAGQEAMNKQFFVENDDGTISAGDAMTDWRSWANQGATLVGQIAANVVGTKGAGLVARPVARGAAKMLAKEVVTEAAQKQLAKNAVKESIQNGALDDVRKLYAAAPDKAAQNAVVNQALSRLGAVGYGAHSAAMASGLRAQQANTEALQHLNGLSNDDLNANEAYQQAYWDLADGDMQGASPEQIRRAAIDQVAESVASDAWNNPAAMATDFGAGMLEGAVGGLGGVAGKIGKTRVGAAARGALVEGGGETLQAGSTQWAVNEAIREWADESRDPMAGVLVQALTEGVIAGPMGGMAAGINGPHTQHGPAKVTTTPLEQSQFGDIDAWATKMADIMGPHRSSLSDSQIEKLVRQSMGKRGASSEFADMVAARAKAMMSGDVMPGQASDTATPVQQPLGAMGGAYDEFADTPAFLRSDNFNPNGRDLSGEKDANPYTDVQDALARGSNAQSVDDLVNASQQAGDQGPTELDTREGEVIPAASNEVVPAQQRGVTIDGESQSMDNPQLPNTPPPRQIGQSDTIFASGTQGENQNNSAYTPPILSRNQVDTSLGEQSTRDPRTDAGQAIQQAGSESDAIFGQLKSLRITKRGKPFATQKEAQLASRKTETPIALPAGGFGVVDKAELEQAQANQASVKQPSSNAGQLGQSGEVLRSPNSASTKATAGEASQVNHDSNEVPGSDVGNGFKAGPYKGAKYRVSTTNSTGAENGTPILEKRMPSGSAATFYVGKDGNLLDGDSVAFNDQSSKERVWRPASKEQTAEAASILDEMGKLDLNDPKRAELKVKLKALVLGETTSTIKPSMQAEASPNQSIRQADQTPTLAPVSSELRGDQPAVGVSAETVTAPAQAEASTTDAGIVPWSESIRNNDGTITLKGDLPAIKQWARDNSVKFVSGKEGIVVPTSHAGKVDAAEEIEKKNTSEAGNQQQVSAPTPEQLEDYGYLREHRGKWQSLSSQGGTWMTSNTSEGAIDQARKHHAYDISNGNPVQTRQERSEQVEKDFAERMDRRHGSKTIDELEGEVEKLSTKIASLQRAGANEFNDGGRRTGAAVANEGARQAGQEKMDLERYIEMRKKREKATVAPPRPVSESEKKWRGAKTVPDYRDGLRSLFSGDMDFAEFKAMSRHMLDNSTGIRAELEKKTKAELIAMMGATDAAMFKGEKKDAIVNRVHRSMISDLRWAANGDKAVMTTGVTELGGGNVTTEQRTAAALEGLTEDRYQQFRDKQISDRKALEERVKAIKKAIANPETLDEFGIFIERRGLDKMTPEQRSKYEDMVAASNLDRRDADKAARDEAKVTPTASGDIIKTKHTKTGEDLFVIQMADRVDRDTYNSINAKAKKLGGWYSSFRGKGAVPGFQFKDETKAAEFREWLGGQSEARAEQSADAEPSQVTEPAPTDSKAKQIEALRTRAANIRTKAEDALNAERKENTSRRAGMAASARASAERDMNFANLLDAIADGIESGEITYLRNLSSATQLEQLQGALRSGMWNLSQSRRDALRAEGAITRDNDSREAWSDKATPEQLVEGVRMPGMDYHAENLRDLARKMQGKTGFKQAGAKIMALANAAVNRDSRTVTLSDPELIAKLKAFVNGSDDYSTSAIKDQIAGYGRLERMGITNQTELRAALRELIRLQKAVGKPATKSDPLTEKNRALKARLLNNRNAFIDFFPTPEEHAQDMAARAGIEPGMRVLEPSAGNGMLADAARDAGANVDTVEIAPDLQAILQDKGHNLIGTDFMATEANGEYDAVIMNPPFSNNMDIDHVRHAYNHLKPGGRLVAIVSAMAGERSNRKNQSFREWLDSLGATEEMMPEGAFKDSLNPTDVRTKIITIEKPESAQKAPTIKAGATATIYTPKGKPVKVQYRIVEAADLVASHEFDGTVNRNYPQTLQPRDRSKGTYQVQVRQIANNPEGERLGASPETDRGAPIVREGIVESGNGRTIGIKQAYNNGTAGDYRAYLEDHAAEFGLDPAEVEAMQQPVLVRERLTEMDDAARRDFVVDSNTDAKMANSASEDAKADAGRLDDRLLGMLNIPEGGDLLAASNEPFLNAFARAIGENSLNQYKDDSGRWNDAYRRRVANAIFAYGYGSDALLKAATGDTDSTGKNITSSLMNNAAKMAELRNAVPEHAADLVNIMAEAIGVVNDARRNGQSLQEVINQGDMLSDGVSHEGGALAEMLSDASRSAKRLTETVGAVLDMLNESARNAGQIDMLTGEPATTITAQDAINAKAREYRIRKEREQQAPRPGNDLFGLTGARDDNRQDAGVSRSAGRGETQGKQGQPDRVEVSGVSVTIPSIDAAQQNDFNQANHRGAGRDFTSEIKTAAGRILNDLQSSGMLETREQKDLAAKLVQAWVDREVSSANKTMAFGIKNPSWLVTGRSGKSATNDAKLKVENDRILAHDKSQDASVKRMKDALKELRSPDAKRAEQFKSEWKMARDIIYELSSLFTQKKEALLSDFRKNYGPDLARHLESMQQANPDRFVEEINAQNKRLIDAGMQGLLDMISPRSKAGKIIASVLKTPGAVFSLRSAADGKRRGMPVKQLELIAKEWAKQYKGAANVRIMVADTQADINEVLAMLGEDGPAKGKIMNGVYLPEYKTMILNAEAIDTAAQARSILRHEVLAHHGLRQVVGDNLYTTIIEAVKRGKDITGIKDAYYRVAENYTDAPGDMQAEEVFAHWLEHQPDRGELAIWWRGIVRQIKDALRSIGLIGERTTEEEFNRVLDAIATGMRNGRKPDRQVMESYAMASRTTVGKMDKALFSVSSDLESAERKLNLGPKPDIIDKTKARIDTLKQADRQQVKSWWSELVRKANTQILDALAPIKYAEELAGKFDASDSGYVAARLASGSATTMQATLLHGLPEWKDGVIQKKAGTGESDSLLGIFEGLGKDLHNWLGWMAGHRAEILMQQGRENLLNQDEINALKGKNKGKEQQFNEAKAKWNALNAAVLDLAQEAGLFTAEDRASWESEWYIPFFRESEDGDAVAPFKTKGIANQSSGIKKLKGGTANVNDLLENIFQTTGKMIDASMKNMAAQKLVWNLGDTDIIDVVARPNLMQMRAANKPGNQMLWVKIEGEDYLVHVKDPALFRAMTMIDQKRERGAVMKVAMQAKHVLTAGVTSSPEFMLRNFLRDAVSAWGMNEDGFTPLIDSIKGVRKTLKMSGGSVDMMFSGASFLGGHVNGNNPEGMAHSVRKALRAKGMNPEQIERYEKSIIRNSKQAMDVLGKYWHKYERIGEAIENGSREAVYEAAIKAGKSHAQAAFEAKDLMDFSMLGSSKVMQFLVDVLPFFNARMQGLGKLGRAAMNNPRQMLMRGGMIAGASLALLALNWEDDRYDKLPDWDKDLNWHFWLGDDHFRIPKPFEIGLMFGTLPERMTRAMGGKDTAGKFGQVVARNMLETFSINPIPQVVKPLAEAYFNYDPFRGGPIDNMSDLNVLPEARYDEQTSLLMRELGELTGFSPKKLQHLVEGYTGTMGAYVLGVGDMLARRMGDYGESASLRADQIPLLRTVYQGSAPARSSQAMSDYYDMLGQVSELYSTIRQYQKEGRTEDARKLIEENRAELAKRPTLTTAQKQFRALRNEMELINRSKILTADQKRERLDRLLERRNNLASKMVSRFGEN